MKYQLVIGALFTIIVSPFSMAEVYSCGPGCYTSSPSRGNGKADLGHKIGSYTSIKPRTVASVSNHPPSARPQATVQRSATSQTARPVQVANTAPVAPRLNPAKNSSRRAILEQELNNERNALANAQKALADGRAVSGQSDAVHQNRIRSLESAVLDRQQNIQALQRELSRM